MRQMSDEGRREIAKELREQFNCCQYAEEFTEGLYDVLDLGHCEPTHGGYPDLAERLADYVEPAPVTGSTSDGFHTFDELYHHRAVLFSVIVAMFRGLSWKSLHHHDGTMYDGMFIVGIDTPAGTATYHYDVEPYWDMFSCRVLDRAPEWDGHTPDDAIERRSSRCIRGCGTRRASCASSLGWRGCLLPFGVQVYCPDNGGALRLTYDIRMQAAKSLREDSTLCLLWAMLMDSYSRWRTTGDVFSEMGESCDL